MKILATIPVEKIQRSPCTYSFRYEVREVEVIRVMRWAGPNNRRLNRFHYFVDIKRHPDLHPEAIFTGLDGAYRVNVVRRGMNPKWKPPVFPDGKDLVEVGA